MRDLRCLIVNQSTNHNNQGTIALSMNPVNRQRSKHSDVRYHFIRNGHNAGKVIIKYCRTADMVANVMTKPVTKIKLQKFKSYIFGLLLGVEESWHATIEQCLTNLLFLLYSSFFCPFALYCYR